MLAEEVKSGKWKNEIILYDDGKYSAIWGNYNNSSLRCLGVRWNYSDDPSEKGFPNPRGNPQWYVEYGPLTKMILLGLLDICVTKNDSDVKIGNILKALKEFKDQL